MYLRDKRTADFWRMDKDIELVTNQMPIFITKKADQHTYTSNLLSM